MRRSLAALAVLFIASLGIAVPSTAAASGDPKVVIIVGATHGATASYRADADRAYAEAIKYTSNVVKVYSPNATWKKVKAAAVGASVIIYMGHGNGWPSPYTYDPAYTTKNGFGLNATAGNGDYNNKYYGEPYVSTLDLAPGAIILLNHLCYAAGNSEPGDPEPSVSVARQRADNYAAGFLKAGAAAVIADGHSGADPYLRALFTTHQSIEDMWRTMPNINGNFVSFASTRTPGATVYQDPKTTKSGFYRALTIGSLGITTDEVVAGGYGDTSVDPTSLARAGQCLGRGRRRGAVRRPGRDGQREFDPRRRTPACGPSRGRARPAPKERRSSKSSGSTIRRSADTSSPPISWPATAAHRPFADSMPAGRSRRTATAPAMPPRSAAGSPNRLPGHCRSRVPAAASSSRRPAAAQPSRPPGTASPAAIRSPTGPTRSN